MILLVTVALNVDDIVSRRSGVEVRSLPKGALLVDMKTGECFRLNHIGAEVWEMLGPGTTLNAVCDTLVGRYPVERSVLETDVRGLVDSLSGAGLVDTTVSKLDSRK